MKKYFIVFVLILIAGCTSAPTETEISEETRQPSSAGSGLSDAYGDVKIYFCSANKALLIYDINRCGEARANNRGCTEMASLPHPAFDLETKGTVSKLIFNGKTWYVLAQKSEDTFVLSKGRYIDRRVEMTPKEFSQAEIDLHCSANQ